MKFVLQLSVLSIIMSGGCFAQSNTIPFNTMADDTIYYYNTTRFAFLSQVKESNTPTAFIDKNMKEIYVYNEMNLNYVKVNVTDDAIFADDKALIKALNDTITQNKYKLTSQMDNAYLITVRSNIMAYKHVCPTEAILHDAINLYIPIPRQSRKLNNEDMMKVAHRIAKQLMPH